MDKLGGNQIGIQLAHRVLADLTQDSLSSFHSAGLDKEDSEQGLKDIIDGVNKGGMYLKINPNYTPDEVKGCILYRKFKYYVTSITNSFLDSLDDDFWYDIGYKIGRLGPKPDINNENIITIRFQLDYHKLRLDGRTLETISRFVFSKCKWVFYSPDFIGIIDIYITNLIELSSVMELLDKEIGIKGITQCNIYQPNVMSTQGSSLMDIVQQPSIDIKYTTSTDIYDVERVYGLEAARYVIYKEIYKRCRDRTSASFMADFMTCKGYVSPFKKDNPMLKDKGFLPSIAFERPKKDIKYILTENNTVDITSSVYSQMVLGELPNTGSGSRLFKLIDKKHKP